VDLIDIRTVAVSGITGLAPALMGRPAARRRATTSAPFSSGPPAIIASAIMVGVVTGRIGVSFWTLHRSRLARRRHADLRRIAVQRTATAMQRAVKSAIRCIRWRTRIR
jgi:hypothetical protein